jgi:hypothetical protein
VYPKSNPNAKTRELVGMAQCENRVCRRVTYSWTLELKLQAGFDEARQQISDAKTATADCSRK